MQGNDGEVPVKDDSRFVDFIRCPNGCLICSIVLIIATPSPGLGQSDEEQLTRVKTTWQDREAAATVATFVYVSEPPHVRIPPDAPADRTPLTGRRMQLFMNGLKIRLESQHRNYDVDGGPHGSRSWQTVSSVLTRSPEHPWRQLNTTDITGIRPSAATAVPWGNYSGIEGVNLFLTLFRGTSASIMGIDFGSWSVCRDVRFQDPRPGIVTLVASTKGNMICLLYLDSNREFIPLRSLYGRWPPVGTSLKSFRETTAQYPAIKGGQFWVPERWTTLVSKNSGQSGTVTTYTLTSHEMAAPQPDSFYCVEFPEDVYLEKQAGTSDSANAATPATPHADAPARHRTHGYLWLGPIAIGVAIVARMFLTHSRQSA